MSFKTRVRGAALAMAAASLVLLAAPTAHAAVLTDPATFSGSGAIDPTSDREAVDVSGSGSTSQAILEARPDFVAVHDFTGFVGAAGGVDNFIDFTGTSGPDIKFRLTLSANPSGGGNTATDELQTSGDSSIYLGSGAMQFDVDLGSYDSGSGIFTSNVNAVAASGFTVTGIGTSTSARTIIATFLDDFGNVLSTQSATSTGEVNGTDFYFGYQVTGTQNHIGAIRLTMPTGTTLNRNAGFDDFGFSVPEPSTALLVTIGGLLFCGRRRAKA